MPLLNKLKSARILLFIAALGFVFSQVAAPHFQAKKETIGSYLAENNDDNDESSQHSPAAIAAEFMLFLAQPCLDVSCYKAESRPVWVPSLPIHKRKQVFLI